MKFKKLLAPLMAVSLIVSAMPVANVSAANDPRVYVDITYDNNNQPRADIMFENLPNINSGGFHIELGNGWKVKMSDIISTEIETSQAGCTSGEAFITPSIKKDGDHGMFVSFSSSNSKGYNLNGRFFSIYLEKTNNFNSDNSEVNVVFKRTSQYIFDFISLGNNRIIMPDNYKAPNMLGAYEYLVGDVNNDGYVDAIDCSQVLSALEEHNNSSFSVDSIKHTYKRYFPEAICPASPDATQDGKIGQLDADLIMKYYMDMSTDGINNSRIGKLDFYELFDD